MPQNAELMLYVGVVDATPQLYTSQSANEPLPSHEFTLNFDVACKFTFRLKDWLNDTFVENPLTWNNNSPPPNVTGPTRSSDGRELTLTVHNTNDTAITGPPGTPMDYSFTLTLTQNGQVQFHQGGIRVDPTIVEKPGGTGF